MKPLFLLKYIFILLCFHTASAQNFKIDSLRNIVTFLNKQESSFINDTSKINALNLLSSNLITAGDLETGDSLASHALLIAEKGMLSSNKSEGAAYQKGMAKSYRNRGNASFYQENYNGAIDFYLKEVVIHELSLADPDQPAASKKNSEKGLSIVLRNIGNAFMRKDDYPKALHNYYRSVKISESLNDEMSLGVSYGNIGIVYDRMLDYPKALEFYQKALQISQKKKNDMEIAKNLANIGTVHAEQKNYPKALEYYDKALIFSAGKSDINFETSILSGIGTIYTNMGEYDKAIGYFQKALKIAETMDDKGMISNLNGNIGGMYLRQNKLDNAEEHLLKALSLAKEIGELYDQKDWCHNLSELYRKQNKTELAFEYLHQYDKIKDTIFNRENSMSTVRHEMDYEYGKKEAMEKAEHEKTVIALEAENRIQRNKRNFIIILALMSILLVTAGLIYFNSRKTLKMRELYSQQLLLSQEKERQRISKELHDSIGQNILFIKNQMIKNNELTLMSSVDEALEEVRNISKDLYPNQLEKYGLIAAVDALAEKVKESSNIFVSHDLEAISKNISPDQLINYYRIIQECISNTMKHADAAALRISAEKVNGIIELTIQDNGKGFDKLTMAKKAQRSFGLLNLEERAKYLKGRFELVTSPGNGTKYIFSLPA